MIPGEMFIKDGEIELNAGRKTATMSVTNTGDRPVQVGSHYHFFETNPALRFDRKKARGMRLDIAAGTAVRFEPGQTRDVTLVALAGKRTVYGFRGDVMGQALMQTYTGSCQCGKVRYEASLDLGEVLACNCSRCGRLGSLLAFTSAENFKLLSGEGATTTYKFNKHVIDHLFCSTCGIQSFARGKQGGKEMVAVNARCLDGVEPETLKVKHVDGRKF